MGAICPKCRHDNPPETLFCGRCATRLDGSGAGPSFTRTLETPTTGFGSGKVFAGRFELIEELGAGGMGVVYRAFDKKVGEEIALKLLHPEIARDERTVERFRNEIKLARKITHKNVCRMHELHEEGQTLFITMEYVEHLPDGQGDRHAEEQPLQETRTIWYKDNCWSRRGGCSFTRHRGRRGGKSELQRAGWSLTATPGDRGKVPQKTHRPPGTAQPFRGARVKWRGKSSPSRW